MKKLTAVIFSILTLAIFTSITAFAADTDLIITADKFSTVGMVETKTKVVDGHTFVYSSPDTSVTGSAFAFNYKTNISMSGYAYAKIAYYSNTASTSANVYWDYAKATENGVTLSSDGKRTTVIIPLKSGLADKNTLLQVLPFGTAKANTLDEGLEFGLEYIGFFSTLEDAESYDSVAAETDVEAVVLIADNFSYVGSLDVTDTRKSGHNYKKAVPDTTVTTGGFAANFKDLQIDIAQYRYVKIGYRSNTTSKGYLRWNYANSTDAIDFKNTNLEHSEIIIPLVSGLTGTQSLFQVMPLGAGKANTLDANAEFHFEYAAFFGNLAEANEFSIPAEIYVVTHVTDADIAITSGVENGVYIGGDIELTVEPREGYAISEVVYTVDGSNSTVITANNGVFTISEESVKGDIDIGASLKEQKCTVSGSIILARENHNPYESRLAKVVISKDGDIVYEVTEDVSSADGVIPFSFSLKPDKYTLEVTKSGYITYTADIEVIADKELDIELIAGDVIESYESKAGNGIIDVDDFIRVLRGFSQSSSKELVEAVDINEDGEVNVTDIGYIKTNFGKNADDYEKQNF